MAWTARSLSLPPRGNDKDRPQATEHEAIAWLRRLSKPCGVFCALDLYAARLTNACRNCKIAVPEQVAVLGVDNDTVMCSVSCPPLSSIDLDSRHIGYEAAALLAQLIEGKAPPTLAVRLQPQGVVARQSTDILAIDDKDVAQAVGLIRQHACRGLRVGQLATILGLSRRVFEQRFQQVLRRTPKQAMLDVQMNRAKLLLRETDLITTAVARKAGFASVEYFSRAFHREVGMTPREYRQKNRFPGPRTA